MSKCKLYEVHARFQAYPDYGLKTEDSYKVEAPDIICAITKTLVNLVKEFEVPTAVAPEIFKVEEIEEQDLDETAKT